MKKPSSSLRATLLAVGLVAASAPGCSGKYTVPTPIGPVEYDNRPPAYQGTTPDGGAPMEMETLEERKARLAEEARRRFEGERRGYARQALGALGAGESRPRKATGEAVVPPAGVILPDGMSGGGSNTAEVPPAGVRLPDGMRESPSDNPTVPPSGVDWRRGSAPPAPLTCEVELLDTIPVCIDMQGSGGSIFAGDKCENGAVESFILCIKTTPPPAGSTAEARARLVGRQNACKKLEGGLGSIFNVDKCLSAARDQFPADMASAGR